MTQQPTEATFQQSLVEKWGSADKVDDEKQRRRDRYHERYQRFLKTFGNHRPRAEYFALWEGRYFKGVEGNDEEIKKCEARIRKLEEWKAEKEKVREQMKEDYRPDVEAWEEDQKMMAKFKAYFALEDDNLDG